MKKFNVKTSTKLSAPRTRKPRSEERFAGSEFLKAACIPASQKIPNKEILFVPTSILFKTETPSPPIMQKRKRAKFSSTETMFLSNVLHTPDVGQIIRCLAKAISLKIKQNNLLEEKVISPIFEEKNYSGIRGGTSSISSWMDRYGEALEFLSIIFFTRKLPAECAVVAVVYIDKLLEVTKLTFHDGNWRIIVFTSLLLANKVWAEHAVWNEDFLKVFSDIWLSIRAICRVERVFLKYLSFDLNIKPSVYSKYYFELRSYMNSTGDLPFKPLDKVLALKLAVRAQKRTDEEKLSSQIRKRSYSLDSFLSKHTTSGVSFDQFRAVRNN
jgi:hypothetical protein